MNSYRSTIKALPTNQSLLKTTKLPIFISLSLRSPATIADCEIIRCSHCKSYLNPFVEVIAPGLKWKCNLCYQVNTLTEPLLSDSHYSFDTHAGGFSVLANEKVNQKYAHLMLKGCCVDVKASSNYVLRIPGQKHIVFVVEATYNSVSRGIFSMVCGAIMGNLEVIDSKAKVGFLFFNENVYLLNRGLNFTIVTDFSEMPFFDENSFLFSGEEIIGQVDKVFMQINYLSKEKSINNNFGGAMLVAERLLSMGGALCVFIGSPCNTGDGAFIEAESNLKCRNVFYKKLANRLTQQGVAVNHFLFPKTSIEMPCLLLLSRFTGGENYYFPNFNATDEMHKRYAEQCIGGFLGAELETDGLCRVRCSVGCGVKYFFGNFHLRAQDLLSMCQSSIRHWLFFEMTVGDYTGKDAICVQIAHLRTVNGVKRIKVINLCIPVIEMTHSEFINSVDLQALVHYQSLIAANTMINTGECIKLIHKTTIETVNAAEMKKYQRVFEDYVRRMLYIQKCVPLRDSSTPVDYKSFYLYLISTHPPCIVDRILEPLLYAVHKNFEIVPLSGRSIEHSGLYMLDTGINIYFFVAKGCDFSLDSFFEPAVSGRTAIIDEDMSARIYDLLGERPVEPVFMLAVDGEKNILVDIFLSYLYADPLFGLGGEDEYKRKVMNEII